MVKPIDVNEMVWRVEALLRRSQIASQRRTKLTQSADSDNIKVWISTETLSKPANMYV